MINRLNIKWFETHFFILYLTYGFYGALTLHIENFFSKPLAYLAIQFLVIAILFTYYKKAGSKHLIFNESFTINRRDLKVSFGLLLFTIFINFGSLKYSLYGDELSYVSSAFAREIELLRIASNKTDLLDNFKADKVIQVGALSFLIFHLTLLVFTRNVSIKKKIITLSCITILFRLAYIFLTHGNANPHPPLQFFPLSIMGSLVGIESYTFKLCYILSFSFLIIYLCKTFSSEMSQTLSFLMIATISTIPLILNLSTIVEPSLWAFICFTYVLFETRGGKKEINYTRLSYLVAMFSLLRQPCFFAFTYILILFVQEKKFKITFKELIVNFHPLVIYLPFLISSIFFGTPSTEINNELQIASLNLKILTNYVSNAIGFPWLFFIPFSFFEERENKFKIDVPKLLFFLILVIIYYSIRVELWGIAKYQAEYALPFAIFGFYKLTKNLVKFNNCTIIYIFLSSVILLNIYSLEYRQLNVSLTKQDEIFYHKYEYDQAYNFIKKNKLEKNTYFIGSTYGTLPEILNDYTVSSLKHSNLIFRSHELAASEIDTIEVIISNKLIKSVIIPKLPIYEELIQEFHTNGWKKIYESKKNTIQILIFSRD